jgi:simple sugar transport system ATP-binding protein
MNITAATGTPVVEPAVAPVLQLQGIGKHFGAIRALHGVDLTIRAGEVVGLMGDNGAGKSTLVRIIAGNFPPSQGTIHFDGREVQFYRPVDSRAVGIEVVYQDLALANNLTAAANVSGGQRQAVAIARTRLSNAKLVMMDEPTAAISVRQVEQVLSLIHRLKEQGIAVMLISHRMPDIFAVCDRVVVMRRGEKRADKPIAESSPEEVTALITGAKEMA